jgi:DNA polymerase
MRTVALSSPHDFAEWRTQARGLLAAGVPPQEIAWTTADAPTLFEAEPSLTAEMPALLIPRGFLKLAETAIRHRDPERFALLYTLLWRIVAGERHLLEIDSDAEVIRARALARQVERDAYCMKAYLRFREIDGGTGPQYLAWFEPEHHVLDLVAPFFTKRFASLSWSILTPARSAHWDGERLTYAAGADRGAVPGEDALEAYWQTYYASIFNPARLKVDAMTRQMPRKYWRNLNETRLFKPLVEGAARRADEMVGQPPTEPTRKGRVSLDRAQPSAAEMPAPDLPGLAAQIRACVRCPLHGPATQAVAGEGPKGAQLMLIGEQPGDQEDLAGRPFVGPAGAVLDRALAEAGIPRDRAYVTNAVKHFKFEPRGKRRIHQRPHAREIGACSAWLEREIELVQPRLLVAMGASAARALIGRDVTIGRSRGRVIEEGGRRLMITIHPASVLRQMDARAEAAQYRMLVEDLARARDAVLSPSPRPGGERVAERSEAGEGDFSSPSPGSG